MVTAVLAVKVTADQLAAYIVLVGMLPVATPVPHWVPFTYQWTLVPSFTMVSRVHVAATAAMEQSVDVDP
jgi:hypothetical protein